MRLLSGLLALTLFAAPSLATVHEARIPLHDHKLRQEDLTAALCRSMHLPAIGWGTVSVDLSGLDGSNFVDAVNTALGDGGNVALDGEEMIVRVDPEKLPRNLNALRHAIETFTAIEAPVATANQRRTYGLSMPAHVDPAKPMVVLVHGLDCNRSNWWAMADLLSASDYQVAYFCYPSDGPIEESASLFAKHMRAMRETYPQMDMDIVAHSMGGLVARRYVEGEDYAGGVKHLIMLGTPNLGSRWATYRVALEWQEHYNLWRHEKDWSPTWMITDGLGEAGRDLKPTSEFLRQLNARQRRDGVAYTIVAGDQHPAGEITAAALDGTANAVPSKVASWWGVRQTESAMHRAAEKLRDRKCKSDGPVAVASTQLSGVSDYVVVKADHNGLYLPCGNAAPASWDVIRDRLAR